MVEKFFRIERLSVTIRRKYMGFVHLIGIASILGLGGNPELEEIGLRRTATLEDYKRMREQGRVAESGMSEGVLVRYINMAVYCDYLKRTQILLDSKYSSYCRQP